MRGFKNNCVCLQRVFILPGSLATPKRALVSLKETVYMRRLVLKKPGFRLQSPGVPWAGMNGGCRPLTRLSGNNCKHWGGGVWGEGGVGLAVFHLQRIAFHVEGFSVFHELLRFI